LKREAIRLDLLDSGVEITHHRIVIAPGRLDAVFEILQLGLKLQEVLVGLEVRIGFGHSEKAFEAVAKQVFGLGRFSRAGSLHAGAARGGQLLQQGSLVRGVALHGFHQIRYEIIALFQLDIDVGPGGLRGVSEPDQPVVDGDRIADDNRRQRGQRAEKHHALPSLQVSNVDPSILPPAIGTIVNRLEFENNFSAAADFGAP
jgi:hypothetical protein